ncbi:MAG TPA: macro domain-containing protein [Candidatus Polarisedimenticolia bacterium]|nr:macro domain-containing protein [Candidatus Polarisedimenticolia bacterium]
MRAQFGSSVVEVVEGDITQQRVDGIITAANAQLAGGAGVDGAIHAAGGPEIMTECRRIGGCPVGQAVATTAGRLSAKKLIHAVGPLFKDGRQGEPKLLASAYTSAFNLASQLGLKTLAAASLSTGDNGYPRDHAARVALSTTFEYLGTHPEIELIRFVLPEPEMLTAFSMAFAELAPTQRLKTL